MSDFSAGTNLLLKVIKDKLSLDFLHIHQITPELFYNSGDKSVFDFIVTFIDKYNKLPDEALLFKNFSELKSIKLPDAPIQYFMDRVRDKFVRHFLAEGLTDLKRGLENDAVISELLDKLEELSRTIAYANSGNDTHKVSTISQIIESALKQAILRRKKTDEISGVSMGFDFLDAVTNGAQPDDFITWSGRPGSAKTHLMLNSFNAAFDQGKNPMFATFEMSPEQLANRIVERRLGISSKSLRFGQFTSFAEKRILEHIEELSIIERKKYSAYMYNGGMSSNVHTLISEVKVRKPEALFVDGAYLLQIGRGHKAKWEVVSETATALKQCALNMHIPVIASYQLNRAGKGKGAGIDTIMYSDAMAQLASIAFTIKKPEEAQSGNASSWGSSIRRIIQIDKGREGENAVIEVELSFGNKPFKIVNVISGDLSHLGYDFEQTRNFSSPFDFSEAD